MNLNKKKRDKTKNISFTNDLVATKTYL